MVRDLLPVFVEHRDQVIPLFYTQELFRVTGSQIPVETFIETAREECYAGHGIKQGALREVHTLIHWQFWQFFGILPGTDTI